VRLEAAIVATPRINKPAAKVVVWPKFLGDRSQTKQFGKIFPYHQLFAIQIDKISRLWLQLIMICITIIFID